MPVRGAPGIAVLGINTARSLTFKDGRINQDQVAFIRETFSRTPSEVFRVLVTHHPLFAFEIGDEMSARSAARSWRSMRSRRPVSTCCSRGTIIMRPAHSASDLVTRAGGALVVQAGTATSTRVREQEQSFNSIDVATARSTSQ